jgi:hypothetical protein
MYITDERQGRLEDADGLPYVRKSLSLYLEVMLRQSQQTLDFLVLEELDFMQSCLKAAPVRKELESQLQKNHAGVATAPWVIDVMKLAVSYAQITVEEEGLWEIDVNIYLSEETSLTANYTPRTACGDLVIKLAEWLQRGALEGLLSYAKEVYGSNNATWRMREATLYLLSQLLNDMLDLDRTVDPDMSVAFLEFVKDAMTRTGMSEPFQQM